MIRVISLALPSLLLAGCFSQQPAPVVDRNGTSQSRANAPVQPSGPGYYTVKRGDTLYRIALDNGQDPRDVVAWNNIVNPSAIKEGQVLRMAPPGAIESGGTVVSNPVGNGPVVEARALDQPAQKPVVVATPSNGTIKHEPRVGKEAYSDEAYARLNRTSDQLALAKPAEPRPPEVKPEVPVTVVPPVAAVAPAVAPPVAGPDDVPWIWPSAAKVVAPFSDSGNKGLDFSGKSGDAVIAAGDGKVVYAGAGLRGYGELVIVKHNSTYLSAYAHNRKILVKEGQQVSRGQKIAEMGNTDADSVKLHFEIRKQGKPVDPAQYLPKK